MHFSVIDRILGWQPGAWIRAEKHLHPDECFLADHFPGTPVLPGVLILEAMAQAGDWLTQTGRGEPPGKFCLHALHAVKFVHFVQPGEVLVLSVRLVREDAQEVELACQAAVEDRIAVLARMRLALRDVPAPAACAANGGGLAELADSRFSSNTRGEPNAEGTAASAAAGPAANSDTAYHWLWLDRFTEFQPGRSARARKRVPCARPGYALGHLFPEQLTAALVLEGLAQTGGLLAFDALGSRKAPIMAKITEGEFCGEAEPGTVLDYSAELERLDEDVAVVCTASHCGERLHAHARILFAFSTDGPGSPAVDPAVFCSMMSDSGVFDASPQRLRAEPVSQATGG